MLDFRQYSELYHYGVKGMKWHEHKARGPEDLLTDFLGGQEEVDRLMEKGNTLYDLYSDQHYGQLAEYYLNDPEAREMMKPYIREAISGEVQERFGDKGTKVYNAMIDKLRENHNKKERESRKEHKKYSDQRDKIHSLTKKSSSKKLHKKT